MEFDGSRLYDSLIKICIVVVVYLMIELVMNYEIRMIIIKQINEDLLFIMSLSI